MGFVEVLWWMTTWMLPGTLVPNPLTVETTALGESAHSAFSPGAAE